MTERFERAYNALIDAFFNGTLAKGDCAACAVGNITAAAHGATIIRRSVDYMYCTIFNQVWSHLFVTINNHQTKRSGFCVEEALEFIKPTGYSEDELAKIEFAFETNTEIHLVNYTKHSEQDILEDQYNGLCAVFEVMCELDNIEIDYKSKLKQKEGLLLV